MAAHGRIAAGEWVAVFGCGGVGLSAVMIAAALGARVIAVDPSPVARARAGELGAEQTAEVVGTGARGGAGPVLDTGVQSDVTVGELTGGGAHVAIDAVGSAATADASVRSLRRRGRHVQVGLMLGDDAGAPLPWDLVVARELEIYGSHGMAAADYPEMLELIVTGRLDPGRLVGATIPLEQAGAALMAMDEPIARDAGITVAVLS